MIRAAEEGDIPEVIRLLLDFHAYMPLRDIPYDLPALNTFVAHLIENGAIFLSEDGICGGLLSPMYFNPSYVVGVELFWWAPKEGRALRQVFEAWARECGASAVQFSALGDDRLPAVTRLYRKAGFTPAEMTFFKRL